MATRKSSDAEKADSSDDDSTNSGIALAQKFDRKIKGQRGAKRKFKKILKLSPPTSPSLTPEPVQRVSGSNISITKVPTSPPSHVHLTEEYKSITQRSPDYNTLNDLTQSTKKQYHYIPPLQHHVGSDTSQQLPSQMEQLAQELAKAELERDRYKNEIEQKQQRLQEYETEIVQYRTKALYFGGQSSTVYHSRIKELEDSLTEHKHDLVTKDAKIKQLESTIESKDDELVKIQEHLNNEKTEMEKAMKQQQQQVEQKQQRLQDYEKQIAQYRTKALYPGGQDSFADHSYDTRIKELEDCLTKHKHDLVIKDAKIKQLEDQLDNKKAVMDKERNIMKQFQETKERELKQNMTKLQNDLDQAKATKSVVEAQLKSIRKQHDEQRQQLQHLNEEFGQTRKMMKLKEEISQNMEEVKGKMKAEIITLEQTIKKLVFELTIARDEKTQLAADQGQNILQLKQQLKEAHNLVEQLTQEKAELKTELQVQQTGFAEDGARAIPNTSLTDEEKLKVCLEQLKEKEEEIVDLNGLISALKEDKRSFEEEITMLKGRVSSEGPPCDVIFAQIEELTKEQQEILHEREELDKKAEQYDQLVNENMALKEKLLHYETDSQSGTSVSTGPPSLPDDTKRDSDKNNLEHMKGKYKNLESYNTKLKNRLKQKEEEFEKQTKVMYELNEHLKKLDAENILLHSRMKKEQQKYSSEMERAKQDVHDTIIEVETLKKEIGNLKKDIKTKEKEIEDHSQKAKEVNNLQEELSKKEIERQNVIDEVKEKQELITALQEFLRKQTDQTVEFEQKWKAAILEMEKDGAVVYNKQRQIDRLTQELKLAQTKAAAKEEDFKQERADRERNNNHLINEVAKYHGIAKTLEEKLTQTSHKLSQAKDCEEKNLVLTSQVKAYSRQCEELKKTMVQLQEKSKTLEEQVYYKQKIASEELQLLHEENKRKSQTIDCYYELLKSKDDELQEVKTTRDRFQQSNLHLLQKQQQTEQARQDLQEQCRQQQQEYQEAVCIQKQQLDQLYHQLHWVVDEEEVTMTHEVLGRGSYGEVKVAHFRGLRVAAKLLHGVIISDFNRGVFIREMDIASRVRHPNLVQFIGAIRGDTTIILTEIMPTSLYKELQKKAMTRSQILGISRDIALALNYLHLWKPNPIIHRDISTPNVLLEPSVGDSFKAKVSDYGAANLQQDTKTDMPGNAAYAAPESRYPDDHTPAMDVYSYSVLLIVMILHCPPATTVTEREEQAKRVSWASMSSLIHRCLNRDRHRRPTMSQILDVLLNF